MNFVDFLKKYSTIDNKFIDDFHSIIDEKYMENRYEFLIDSEILQKWLKITVRDRFIENIKLRYKKNVDYKVIIQKISIGRGGHNRETIMLTPDATKKICMMTHSKMGTKIRQYFIDVEIMLYKYKDYIIDGLKTKSKQLENNQKPKINQTKGLLYVFRALNTDLTLYKIGRTINSKNRFKTHNSPMANDLEVLFQYETDDVEQVEQCVKVLMKVAQYRKYKEIYQIDISIIKNIIQDCDAKIQEVNKKIKKQKGGIPVKNSDVLYMFIPKST